MIANLKCRDWKNAASTFGDGEWAPPICMCASHVHVHVCHSPFASGAFVIHRHVRCCCHCSTILCVRMHCMQVRPELFVDTSRGERLQINVDVTFHSLPCACELNQLTISHPLHKICIHVRTYVLTYIKTFVGALVTVHQ